MKKLKHSIGLTIAILALSGCSNPNAIQNVTTADINATEALIFLQQGKLNTAEAKLSEAFAANANIPAVWDTQAYLESVTGHFEAAEKDYLKAIKLAPHSGPAHNNYGIFLCQRGRIQHAIQEFITATQEPNYYNTDTAYQNAGLCAMNIDDFENAEYYLKKSLTYNAQLTRSLYTLALIRYYQRDYAGAKYYLSKYEALTPTLPKNAKKFKHLLHLKHHPFATLLPEPLSREELRS